MKGEEGGKWNWEQNKPSCRTHKNLWVRSFEMIQSVHADHGRSNEPMNPLWTRIHRFIWSTDPSDLRSLILIQMISIKRTSDIFENLNRVFSLTWPASMQSYWNKRKRLHKKRVHLPQDWFGTPIWPRFYCFGTPIWPPWRHEKTPALLTNAKTIELIPVPSGSFFQPWSCPEKMKAWTLRVWNKIIEHSIITRISSLYVSSYLKSLISIRIKLLFLGWFPLLEGQE